MPAITKDLALAYHEMNGKPGKLAIQATKPLTTQCDLGLAYTPGVAYPVLEIDQDPQAAYRYTNKGNLVAVVTNGTAILGLGDRGALASKPVMEGKAVLFKKFANLDSIDIEIDSRDPATVIAVTAAIASSFGGINLEDIKSPECFLIERTLQSQLDIPVFHDDQHGTAIILGAALLNALDLTGKNIGEIKIVFCGAGAAAIASADHLVKLGVPREHIWMVDIHGLVYTGRKEDMFPEKTRYAQGDKPAGLEEALEGADVFIGLSVADIITQAMLKRMTKKPVIFAMANPNPEIKYKLAREARPDAIVGTGRSDYPNQINNLLGFPYIFRGALDARARSINDAMKIAVSRSLAKLAHEPVPADVLRAYELEHLEYGCDYIVPKPLDPRLCTWIAPEVAKAAIESGIARCTLDPIRYRDELANRTSGIL